MIFCRCAPTKASIAWEWVGEGRAGWKEETPFQLTRHHQLSTDGPNHAIRPGRHHSGHANDYCPISGHQYNVSTMVLQGCNHTHQKSRPLKSDHRGHSVWTPFEYSYQLGQLTCISMFVRTRLVLAQIVSLCSLCYELLFTT